MKALTPPHSMGYASSIRSGSATSSNVTLVRPLRGLKKCQRNSHVKLLLRVHQASRAPGTIPAGHHGYGLGRIQHGDFPTAEQARETTVEGNKVAVKRPH